MWWFTGGAYVIIGICCTVIMLGHLANKIRTNSLRVKLTTIALLLLINCTLWLPALLYMLVFVQIEDAVFRNNLIAK